MTNSDRDRARAFSLPSVSGTSITWLLRAPSLRDENAYSSNVRVSSHATTLSQQV